MATHKVLSFQLAIPIGQSISGYPPEVQSAVKTLMQYKVLKSGELPKFCEEGISGLDRSNTVYREQTQRNNTFGLEW